MSFHTVRASINLRGAPGAMTVHIAFCRRMLAETASAARRVEDDVEDDNVDDEP